MMHSAFTNRSPEWSSRLRTKRGLKRVDYYGMKMVKTKLIGRSGLSWYNPIFPGSLMAITLRCRIPAEHTESAKTWNLSP